MVAIYNFLGVTLLEIFFDVRLHRDVYIDFLTCGHFIEFFVWFIGVLSLYRVSLWFLDFLLRASSCLLRVVTSLTFFCGIFTCGHFIVFLLTAS